MSTDERVWAYIMKNRQTVTAVDIALNCDVTEAQAQNYLDRISSPNWREEVSVDTNKTHSALDNQVGGAHYKDMDVQPWQAMEAWLTPEEYRGYHKGTAIGYIARERSKGGMQDIEKAVHHLQRLIEMQGEDSADDTQTSAPNIAERTEGTAGQLGSGEEERSLLPDPQG
jgi:hypothetical protein